MSESAGRIADSMFSGAACQHCGSWFSDWLQTGVAPGKPRTCERCLREARAKRSDALQASRRKKKKNRHQR